MMRICFFKYTTKLQTVRCFATDFPEELSIDHILGHDYGARGSSEWSMVRQQGARRMAGCSFLRLKETTKQRLETALAAMQAPFQLTLLVKTYIKIWPQFL